MLLALAPNHAASSEPPNGNIAEDNAESALLAGVIGQCDSAGSYCMSV